MHEIEMKLRDICEMKEKFISWSKEEMEKGKDCVDTQEMGDVVDMIKDLADAEKNIWKACYYKTVVHAMEEYDEESDDDDRMGYDNWRYSSGKFAPSGRGHFAGYPMKKDRSRNPGTFYDRDDSMGYPEGQDYGIRGMDNMQGYPTMPKTHLSQTGPNVTTRYGYPYDEWNEARRNYTESHSDSDKKMMEHKAMEHATGAVESLRHIWKEADPALKEKLKKELKPLTDELTKQAAAT